MAYNLYVANGETATQGEVETCLAQGLPAALWSSGGWCFSCSTLTPALLL